VFSFLWWHSEWRFHLCNTGVQGASRWLISVEDAHADRSHGLRSLSVDTLSALTLKFSFIGKC